MKKDRECDILLFDDDLPQNPPQHVEGCDIEAFSEMCRRRRCSYIK